MAATDSTPLSSLPWYALQVRSRWEKHAAAALREKGYEQFLPLYLERRRWSDRFQDVPLPMFPGYVFCRFDPASRLPILTTPGVVSIIGGKNPAPVDDQELDAIAKLVRSGLPAAPWPFLKIGQRVRIEHGSLAGAEGLLLALKKDIRVVMSISLLQRSVAVEIDRDWIAPVGAPQG